MPYLARASPATETVCLDRGIYTGESFLENVFVFGAVALGDDIIGHILALLCALEPLLNDKAHRHVFSHRKLSERLGYATHQQHSAQAAHARVMVAT